MNGPDLRALAIPRLQAEVPGWVVYDQGTPDGVLPARYLVVRTAEGTEESTRACDSTNVQTPSLWVTAVVRHGDAGFAAREAGNAAALVRAAFRDWRPEGRWALRPNGSLPAGRDESIPTTTAYAVEQFALRSTV